MTYAAHWPGWINTIAVKVATCKGSATQHTEVIACRHATFFPDAPLEVEEYLNYLLFHVISNIIGWFSIQFQLIFFWFFIVKYSQINLFVFDVKTKYPKYLYWKGTYRDAVLAGGRHIDERGHGDEHIWG